MSRIVTVLGATGSQGGSVVNAILADGTFTPRAITRDVSSKSAAQLKALDPKVEVVAADLTDVGSLEKAIRGSEAVFLVTVPFIEQSELDQALKVIEASKNVGVKFLVFSSLPDLTKHTGGKLTKADFFDVKARIEEHVEASGIPHAFVYTGYFLENAWKFGFLKPNPTNPHGLDYWVNNMQPDTSMPFSWIERDLGLSVLALLKNYREGERESEVLGGRFYALSERKTFGELMEVMSRVLGRKVNFAPLATTGIEGLDQTGESHRDFGFYPGQPIPDPNLVKLGVQFGTVEEFVKVNRDRHLAAVGQA